MELFLCNDRLKTVINITKVDDLTLEKIVNCSNPYGYIIVHFTSGRGMHIRYEESEIRLLESDYQRLINNYIK